MIEYFGYDTERKEAVYKYSVLIPIDHAESNLTNIVKVYETSILSFTFNHISEIYLNSSGEFEKRAPRPNEDYIWKDSSFEWVPNISVLKARKKIEIDEACAAAIVGGFMYETSLGEFTYPTKQNDQMNMASSVLDSLLTSDPEWLTYFWCMDSTGKWQFKAHTASQIQQVGQAAKAHIMSKMFKNTQLQEQIDDIQDNDPNALETLNEIVW